MSQSFYQTHTYRIARCDKNDWYARGLAFCGYGGLTKGTNYYIHLCLNQLSGKSIKSIIMLVSKAVHQLNVLALDVAKFV